MWPDYRLHEGARVQRASISASVASASILIHDSDSDSALIDELLLGDHARHAAVLEPFDRGAGRLQRHFGYTLRDGTNEHPVTLVSVFITDGFQVNIQFLSWAHPK